MQVPYNITPDSITVFCNGKICTVLSDQQTAYAKLAEHLRTGDHDPDTIEKLSSKEAAIRACSAGNDVEVKNGTVYYLGQPIHNSLTTKLLNLLDKGFDAKPWINFLERLMMNPSYRSREALYDFLDHFNAPITPDGKFIAFKRIRKDWKDIYSGKFDNSVGKYVSMPRSEVDDDNRRTCSAGLHVCADQYLEGFATWSNSRTVAVEVDPADVVSVPYDYNFAKMRTCGYKVLHEIESKERINEILDEEVYYYGEQGDDEYDYYYDDYL